MDNSRKKMAGGRARLHIVQQGQGATNVAYSFFHVLPHLSWCCILFAPVLVERFFFFVVGVLNFVSHFNSPYIPFTVNSLYIVCLDSFVFCMLQMS